MPCAPGSGAGHQPAPPSHRWRWEHWVKGSVGARLEIPAEGLQAWGGGSQTEETLQSPRATGKEADFQQGLGCAAAAGGGGPVGRGLPPSFAPGPEGVPRPSSGHLAGWGCPQLPVRLPCRRPHPPTTAVRPKSYFRRLVETRPVWPDRGTAPPTGPSLPGFPALPARMTHTLAGPLATSVQGSP